MKAPALLPGIIFLLTAAGCRQAPPMTVMRRDLERAAAEIAQLPFPAKLTMPEARRLVLAFHPDLAGAARAVRAAEMAYRQQLGAYLPRIAADFTLDGGLRNNVNAWHLPATEAPYRENFNTRWGVSASWLLFDGMVRELDTLAARSGVIRQEHLRRDLARLLIRGTDYAFCDVLLARAQIRIAEADLAFQQSALRQAECRHQAGFLAEGALLNFRIRAIRARSRALVARDAEQTASFALAVLMGLPDGQLPRGTTLDETPPLLTAAGTPEAWIEQAFQTRSDLAALVETVRIARYAHGAAIGKFFPTVSGVLDFSGTTSHYHFRRYSVSGSSFATWDFHGGLVAEWVLFDGFSRWNRLRETTELAAAAQLALHSDALAVIREVRTAHRELTTRLELVTEYRQLQELAHIERDLTAREYQAGRVTITRLNEAQSDFVEAQSALAAAEINAVKAASGLIAASGGAELPEPLIGPRWFDRPFQWLQKELESEE